MSASHLLHTVQRLDWVIEHQRHAMVEISLFPVIPTQATLLLLAISAIAMPPIADAQSSPRASSAHAHKSCTAALLWHCLGLQTSLSSEDCIDNERLMAETIPESLALE